MNRKEVMSYCRKCSTARLDQLIGDLQYLLYERELKQEGYARTSKKQKSFKAPPVQQQLAF